MAIEVFNRVEKKFILNEHQYKNIYKEICEKMACDKYSADDKCYTISNIYYDTEDNSLIRASLQKPQYKEKIRLRAYGVPSLNTQVYLEIKKKYKKVVNKRRTALQLNEAYSFMSTGIIPKIEEYMNMQVLMELFYAREIYKLVPKVYIAYDRNAFFAANPHDELLQLRVTFDRNIRTRRSNISLEQGSFGDLLVENGTYIMEIKFVENMPLWLVELLNKNGVTEGSFSKYGTEYKKYLTTWGKEGYLYEQYA